MKMLRQLLHRPLTPLINPKRLLHHKISPKKIGISLVKTYERDEEECAYPSFKQFNVETQDRCHSFSVPCDKVVKSIKLGAINKHIAIQYCHYLAKLARESETQDDVEYYSAKCVDLMMFLLRNDKDLPAMTTARLMSDIADTTKKNCILVGSQLLSKTPWRYGFRKADYAQLLGACYKFGLWEQADAILDQAPSNLLTFRMIDPFILGVMNASKDYKSLQGHSDKQQALRSRLITSMTKLCGCLTISRVQMVTKQKDCFVQALKDLDLKVRVNSPIKMSGRCTGCDSHIPLFDHRLVSTINSAIKSQVMKGSEKGIYLNTSPNDVSRFEVFLQALFEKDKKPIDCVIDGLNIAYRSSVGFSLMEKTLNSDVSRFYKVPRPESQANVLINCIIRGDMLKHFKKILVVGKWHMTKWPGLMEFFDKHNIHFYSSYNNSKDDLFQLFAATLSPKTVLVTNDFLRDHLAQLEEDERALLERWIDTHQAWICQRTLKPIWPTPFEKIPSTSQEGQVLHLPVIDFHQLDKVGIYEPPPHLNSKMLTWICCNIKEP